MTVPLLISGSRGRNGLRTHGRFDLAKFRMRDLLLTTCASPRWHQANDGEQRKVESQLHAAPLLKAALTPPSEPCAVRAARPRISKNVDCRGPPVLRLNLIGSLLQIWCASRGRCVRSRGRRG